MKWILFFLTAFGMNPAFGKKGAYFRANQPITIPADTKTLYFDHFMAYDSLAEARFANAFDWQVCFLKIGNVLPHVRVIAQDQQFKITAHVPKHFDQTIGHWVVGFHVRSRNIKGVYCTVDKAADITVGSIKTAVSSLFDLKP